MHAAFTPTYGPATILEQREVPEAPLQPGEIRVEVYASPVTAGDLRLRSASFPGITALPGRLMMGILGPRRPIQGTMFSGRVVEVAADVTRFAVGDAVFGQVDAGAWAERVVVAADGPVALRPESFDDDEAASVPYGAGTALHFLVDLADVQPGEHVLVLGGSGGVGRYAIQIAKQLGARVTAVGSRDTFELMRRLGADAVLDYRTEDFRGTGETYDVVFDIADASSFAHAAPSLAANGRYLTLFVSLNVLFHMARTALTGGRRALFAIAMGGRESAERLREWMVAGRIRPVVLARYPLAHIREAHAHAERGAHGSVLVHPTRRAA